MGRKSKINQQPTTIEVIDLTTEKAKCDLDLEYLHFLKHHSSEKDKAIFHKKYTDMVNHIRLNYGLTPVEFSKTTGERIDLGETKVPKKRGRKPKQPQAEHVERSDQSGITATIEVDTTPRNIVVEGLAIESNSRDQLYKMMGELENAKQTLNQIMNIVSSLSSKL